MRRVTAMNGRWTRCLVCFLAISAAFALGGCSACGARTTLPITGAGGGPGTQTSDSGASDGRTDGHPLGGAGGATAEVPDGAANDSPGIPTTGGAGQSGAITGGTGGPSTATGGTGALSTGGQSDGGASGGGGAFAGRGGGGMAGAVGSGGVVTGGKGGGPGGAGGGGVLTRDAGDGPTDNAPPDGATPLWRNSYEAFSQRVGGFYPLVASVWSDDRGVFLLTYDDSSPPAIWANLGQGWQTSYTWPQGTSMVSSPGKDGLRGFVDGALVTMGLSPCSIQFVDGQGARCSGAGREIVDVSIISANLAYAIYYSDRILRFDGSFWTQLGDPLPPPATLAVGQLRTNALWADATTMVIVTNEDQDEGFVYLVSSEGQPVLQTGLPVTGFTAAWGFGSQDIWVGGSDGSLFHYDGAGWTPRGSLAADGYGIIKMWGIDGKLFMVTSTQFAEWDGSRVITLESLDSDRVYKDLWGNSAKEVFVTLENYRDPSNPAFQVRWFDGSSIHQL